MFVEKFAAWAATADANARCDAIAALCKSWNDPALDEADRLDCEAIFAQFLHDPAEPVRVALARGLSLTNAAPHAFLWTLAADRPSVAAQVYAFSMHFRASDLSDAASSAAPLIQSAIAARGDLEATTIRALVESAGTDAALSLLANDAVALSPALKHTLAIRHKNVAAMRGALLECEDLWPDTRHILVMQLTNVLAAFSGHCGGRENNARLENDAILDIASDGGISNLERFVRHLSAHEKLTTSLLLQAVCGGHAAFFEHAMAMISAQPLRRVQALCDDRRTGAFAALYSRTTLPNRSLPVFLAVLECWAARKNPTATMLLDRVSMDATVDGATIALLSRLAADEARDVATFEPPVLAIAA